MWGDNTYSLGRGLCSALRDWSIGSYVGLGKEVLTESLSIVRLEDGSYERTYNSIVNISVGFCVSLSKR